MKNTYITPEVSFEDFVIDQKIAGVCSTDWTAIVHEQLLYFNENEGGCTRTYTFNYNLLTGEPIEEGKYKTICYHSVGSLHES